MLTETLLPTGKALPEALGAPWLPLGVAVPCLALVTAVTPPDLLAGCLDMLPVRLGAWAYKKFVDILTFHESS